jgi:uncharacterized protein
MTNNFTDEKTVLLEAVKTGNTESVVRLLDGGAEVDAKDASGATALMHAVKGEQIETIRVLIERGADRNAKGKFLGFSPIVFAVKASNADILELLLEENDAAELSDLQFAFGVAQLLGNPQVLEQLNEAIIKKSV